MDWWGEITARMAPTGVSGADPRLDGAMWVAVALGLAVALIPAVWQVARIGVTLVHELGHALVGLLAGRRFTGFVVREDMSGHAVTVGPDRGAGRVLTTWAGYPAPAVLGAVMVWAASRGWAAPLLAGGLVVLLLAVPRIRSFATARVTLLVTAVTGALWWWGSAGLQAQSLTVVGILLIIGAWRHLASVALAGRDRVRDRTSDPAVLAGLTHLPRIFWVATFALAIGLSTWLAGQSFLGR